MNLADRVLWHTDLGLRAAGWYWLDEDGVAHGPMSNADALAAASAHFELRDVG